MKSARLVLCLILLGCVRGEEPEAPEKTPPPKIFVGDELPPLDRQGAILPGGTLRVAMGAEPHSLNFQLDPLDAWSKTLHELVYSSLAAITPRTGNHEPMLAERWEISDDGLTFTFYLRRDVRWHDGKPFTARDVTFTFERLLDPTSKTVGIRSFLEPIRKVQQIDDYTVRFGLKRRYWLAFDAIAEIFIYPQHVFAKGDFNNHPNNRHPVGTGPYTFVHWRTGEEIVYQKNPTYFGRAPHLDRLVFTYVPDPTVRLQMLRAGELDVVLHLDPESWAQIAHDQTLSQTAWRLRHVPSGLQWIGWNQQRPMFADARVRRAMTMLIDREDIVRTLRGGLDSTARSWFYPGSKEFNASIQPWPHDPEGARALLAEAGWVDTDGDGVRDKDGVRFSFTLLYPAGAPFYGQLAGTLRTAVESAGIELKTLALEWGAFNERLRRHDFDACALSWQLTPRSDPTQIWHSSSIQGGLNFVSFRHPEADALLEAARAEFDEDARNRLYHRFSRILHDEQPYTMLFNRYHLSLVSKRFAGITSSPYGIIRIEELARRAP